MDGNGHATTYAYDARNRLTAETDTLGNTVTYAYDKAGNKIRTTDPRGNATSEGAKDYTTWYRYDDLNRLIQAILLNGAQRVTTYRYDLAGNHQEAVDLKGVPAFYAYLANNLLQSITWGSDRFVWSLPPVFHKNRGQDLASSGGNKTRKRIARQGRS
ncbi:MAG: hypothetical protein M1379_12830 [Firmicutes bacterium]|nr:hypothetical protein [Bacillota bacterium]